MWQRIWERIKQDCRRFWNWSRDYRNWLFFGLEVTLEGIGCLFSALGCLIWVLGFITFMAILVKLFGS